MAMTLADVVEEVVVVQEECGDEYILPEYTTSTPSTNSTPERRSSLPQNTRATREKILDQSRTALITRATGTTHSPRWWTASLASIVVFVLPALENTTASSPNRFAQYAARHSSVLRLPSSP